MLRLSLNVSRTNCITHTLSPPSFIQADPTDIFMCSLGCLLFGNTMPPASEKKAARKTLSSICFPIAKTPRGGPVEIIALAPFYGITTSKSRVPNSGPRTFSVKFWATQQRYRAVTLNEA